MALNHGVSLAFYFDDPEGNMIEIYWATGLAYGQPYGHPIDLALPEKALLRRPRGVGVATGHVMGPSESPLAEREQQRALFFANPPVTFRLAASVPRSFLSMRTRDR